MSDLTLFLILATPGALCLGVYDVLVKKTLSRGVSEHLLLGVISSIVGLTALAVLFLIGFPELGDGFYSAIIITTTMNVFAQWFWFKAFQKEDVSVISPFRLVSPLITVVVALVILGEQPTFLGVLGIIITLLGLWYLNSGGFPKSSSVRASRKFVGSGVWYAALGAISFGISFPFDKLVVVNSSPLVLLGISTTAIGVVNLIWYFISAKRFDLKCLRGFWIAVTAICIVFFISQVLNYSALNYALAAYASSFKRLSALFAVLIGGLYLQEKDLKRRILATIIMVAGVVFTIFG